MKNLNFVALDFETANAYRRSACSIGMVKVEDGKIVDVKIEYPKSFTEQMLEYSKNYSYLPAIN
jgi:DNA polymerase III epsilon subunit-like protein